MIRKRTGLIIIITAVMSIVPFMSIFAQDHGDILVPLSDIKKENIRLIEGNDYCYAGYGTQNTLFSLDSGSTHSNGVSTPYLPSFQPILTTYLKLGCVINQLFFNYYLINNADKFNQTVTHEGNDYNSIQFNQDVLSIGYSFSIIPHSLYIDLGVGYSQFTYKLGLYNSPTATDNESNSFSEFNYVFHGEVKYFFSNFFFIQWQHQKSIGSGYVVSYSNQLGINFLSRF